MSKIKLSIPTRPFGWTDLSSMHDPRMPRFDFWYYEVRYGFTPDGYQVIKRHVVHEDVVEVLVSGLTKEAAEGFIKLLKEN
jgi:hypothetical protein